MFYHKYSNLWVRGLPNMLPESCKTLLPVLPTQLILAAGAQHCIQSLGKTQGHPPEQLTESTISCIQSQHLIPEEGKTECDNHLRADMKAAYSHNPAVSGLDVLDIGSPATPSCKLPSSAFPQ